MIKCEIRDLGHGGSSDFRDTFHQKQVPFLEKKRSPELQTTKETATSPSGHPSNRMNNGFTQTKRCFAYKNQKVTSISTCWITWN